MLRGLDRTTANQLCSRTYEDKGSGGGRKDSIQKKDEMLHSPNEADSLAFYIHLLREKGIYPKTTGVAKVAQTIDMEKAVSDWDFEQSEQAYTDPILDLFPESSTF